MSQRQRTGAEAAADAAGMGAVKRPSCSVNAAASFPAHCRAVSVRCRSVHLRIICHGIEFFFYFPMATHFLKTSFPWQLTFRKLFSMATHFLKLLFHGNSLLENYFPWQLTF
jgi:hypothetical protein